MKIILEWDGDQSDLLRDETGEDIVDNIIWLLDYGKDKQTINHNDIKITKEINDENN